ncbi:hypothetical protein BGX38DRAFT_234784 [Terfezia claveryi]|nr:hypothetical protein BGX38DRAFT_234784 [Terfezia claveryi]
MMSPTLPAVLEEALAREKETKEGAAKPLPPLSPTLPLVLEEALATLGDSPKIMRSGITAAKREASVDDTITLKPSKAMLQTAGKGAKGTASATTKKGAVSKATASPTKPTSSQHLKVPGEPKKQLSLKKVAAEVPVGRIKKREVSESPAKHASSPAMTAKSRSGGCGEPSEDDTSDTEPKLSKIVKLKFKHLKWRYENFVKLTRNSKDKVAEPEKRPGSGVAGKSTGKRIREAEDRERTPVPKKLKMEKPQFEIKSERVGMVSKGNTPVKCVDLLPPVKKEKATAEKTAVWRAESRNGDMPLVKVNTGRTATPVPSRDTGRLATPVPVVKKEGRPDDARIEGRPRKVSTSQPPPQLDSVAIAKAEAFNQEHLRYQDFGKRLKHEAEGKIQSDRVENDERYAKLLLLDSILYISPFPENTIYTVFG